MGPGVPKDRVAAIRTAYEKTLKAPEFLDMMRQESLAIIRLGPMKSTRW